MKWITVVAFLMLVFLFCCGDKQKASIKEIVVEADTTLISSNDYAKYVSDTLFVLENIKCPNVFKKNLGYLRKKEAIEILKITNLNLYDSVSYQDYLKEIPDNSYMGKYYKEKEGNKYLLYIENANSSNHVFEIYLDLNIIKYRNFPSGNYNCCWGENFDGFKKMGNYYSIRYCGTGSAYCAGHVYVFKDLGNVPENSIMEQCFMFDFSKMRRLNLSSSVNNITNTSLNFSYKYTEVDEDSDKVLLTKYIDVEYVLVGNQWVAKNNIDIQEMFGLY